MRKAVFAELQQRLQMRSFVAGAIAFLVCATLISGPARAVTCQERASNCMKNGGTKDVCYGAALASCKRTCTYVGAYSGKSFPASGDCGSAAKAKKGSKN